MTVTKWEVRAGAYYDSVLLMQLQRSLAGLAGVVDAGVVMATPANRELLLAGDLWPEETTAKADDLLIVVKGKDEAAAVAALAQVDSLLQRRRSQTAAEFQPKSLASAVKALPNAQWVLVSVPGRYAAGVAQEALALGKHVFLYSDNVPLADEVVLKQVARQKGLLLMGPDCGTAVINGIGLGFANRVRRGRIGLVAASGTGLQAVATEIHNLGSGLSQAIGTGGRDLQTEVGAVTAQQALATLARDPVTKVIVLISKPPSPPVATRLLQAAQATGKDVVVNFLGYPPPGRQIGDLHFATSLTETAEIAVHLATSVSTSFLGLDERKSHPGFVRGLFSGGTLAYEALLGLSAILDPIYSNIPLRPEQKLPDVMRSQGHTIVDMGEDIFTQGRLHPMMDNDLRLRRLRQETADPQVGYLLLDVVLGEGAHPDPASELAPAIAEARAERGNSLEVIAVVVGTEEDPQDLLAQIERLMAAGATVFPNTMEAVNYIFTRMPYETASYPAIDLAPFRGGLAAINIGLESFHDSLKEQGAEVIQVDWRPPAGGNEKLMEILARMKKGN
jgi:FdrA protein